MIPADRVDGPAGWRVSIAAMLCLAVGPSALLVASFGTFVAPLSAEFGWSRGEIGLAVSLMAVTIMLVAPIQGVLIDRFGPRRVVLVSVPLFALGLAALALLPRSLTVYYAAWIMLPILAFGVWPASYLKSVSSWFVARLGLAIGVANAGIGIGTIIVPPIANRMIEAFGVRNAFVGMGLLALTALPVALLFLRERPADAAPGKPAALWGYAEMARQKEWRTIAVGFFLLGISGTGLLANLVPILASTGADQATAVVGMSLFGIAALTGRFVTGWLLDRFHAVRVANIFAAASATALLTLAAGPPVPLAMAAAVLLGLISGAEFDILAYVLRRYFGMRSFGKMYGAIFSLFQLGAGAGAITLAASVASTGSYSAALVVLAVATGLFMIGFARLGPYPARPIPSPAEAP